MMTMKSSLLALTMCLPIAVGATSESTMRADAGVEQPSESLNQRVGELVANLRKSRETIKQYEWIETTTVFLKGEQKAQIEKRCYYGAGGKVEKVMLTQPAPPERKRGLRGIIMEKKKAELTDEMKQAVETLHQYVPPSHEQIEACKAAGNASIDVVDPGKRVRLNFKDYKVPGDKLSIEVDLTNNRPATLAVTSYLDTPAKPLTCNVTFGALEDGTTYAEETTLNLEKQNLKVVVENSGYRKP
ncbi:MAG: hypothetical protein KF805_04990 [Phycisphaeraceae bacterium]|nr:hypothetical protein [Phycisphaeraceae bacterium]